MMNNYDTDNKTVNPFVAGSSPARGAKYKKPAISGLFYCMQQPRLLIY